MDVHSASRVAITTLFRRYLPGATANQNQTGKRRPPPEPPAFERVDYSLSRGREIVNWTFLSVEEAVLTLIFPGTAEKDERRRPSILRDATGAPVRMIGGMEDLTERKQSEERIAELIATGVVLQG